MPSRWYQGLAVMEHRANNVREARELFGRAIAADPAHVWSYQVQPSALTRQSCVLSRGRWSESCRLETPCCR